jgi:hypothetical protein
VPFQRLEDDFLHLVVRHAEEPFCRRLQRRVIAANLHVGDGLDRHRNAFQRVGPLDFQRDRHHVQVEVLHLFEEWNPQRGTAAHHPVTDDAPVGELALASAEDGDGVRRDLDVVAAEQVGGGEERENDAKNRENQRCELHIVCHEDPWRFRVA